MPTKVEEPKPKNREQAVAKTYAVEIADMLREQGWDPHFFVGALLWAHDCYERGAMRREVTA